MKQKQIEKIQSDYNYRRKLFQEKSSQLKVLISKISRFPTGILHPDLVREICEIDSQINMIREIDHYNENAITKLTFNWKPFMGWTFFEKFLTLPRPVSDQTIQQMLTTFPNLTHEIYNKLNIKISNTKKEPSGKTEKVECKTDQKHPNYKNLTLLAKNIVEILSNGDKIKHEKLKELLKEKLPKYDLRYDQHLSQIFRDEARIFYKDEIIKKSGFWYLKNPEIYTSD